MLIEMSIIYIVVRNRKIEIQNLGYSCFVILRYFDGKRLFNLYTNSCLWVFASLAKNFVIDDWYMKHVKSVSACFKSSE